jgi:hypothetical protein
LKWYFESPDDPRDRLRSEWEFATFAWRCGLRNLPEPIACDTQRRIAVFEFLPGRKLAPAEVSGEHVRAAREFLRQLDRHRELPAAAGLLPASEACFSIAEHLERVRERVRRLQDAATGPAMTAAAQDFIQHALVSAAERVEESALRQLNAKGLSPSAVLPLQERILSPSDFGFHNAFVDRRGQLRFFDFEYAGWDDPAKTVCDFFSQVAIPVPPEHWSDFIAGIMPARGGSLAERAELLRPLYLVKWCCIVLNPLLPAGRARRQFSSGRSSVTETECLERAKRILKSIPV